MQQSVVDEITGCKQIKNHKDINEIHLNDQDKSISDPADPADTLNRGFKSVRKVSPGIIHKETHNLYDDSFPMNSNLQSFFVVPTNTFEVFDILNQLKNNKSVGIDGLSAVLIKTIGSYIADVLKYILNLSFHKGTVPDQFKSAMVVPIYKKGSFK